jgi:putative transposase
MAQLGRYVLPDQPLHVIQRGNHCKAIFVPAEDEARDRDWLTDAASDHGCAVHCTMLMTNHVAPAAHATWPDSLPRTMQAPRPPPCARRERR